MSEHPSLQPCKPIVILDNKTLSEVKADVKAYSQKLEATITEIENNASIYEREAVKQALHETLKEEYSQLQGFLTQVLEKLNQLNPNAELEREVLEKLNRKLS